MRRFLVTGVFLLLASVASPLWAGAVYVPFAADLTVGNIQYETQIWASNRGSELRRATTVFIDGGQNGVNRDGVTPGVVGVQPGATVLVDNVVARNTFGMLEVSGAPQLVVSARLVPVGQGGGRLGGHLPVISSENLISPNGTIGLQGLARDTSRISDLMVVNLAQAAASCSVSSFLANGETLGNPAQISLAPLTVNRYEDVLNILGQPAATGVRVSVSCNQTFYAFALALDSSNGNVTVISPAEMLTSALIVPGTGGGGGGGGGGGECGNGALCFERTGTFYIPTTGESIRRETFPLETGAYSRAEFQVEVEMATQFQSPLSGLHSLFWLAINRHFRLLGFAAAKGPNANTVLFRHGINIAAPDKPRFEEGVAWQIGQTYKIDFVYDTGARSLELKILDSSGNVLVRITDRTNVNHINIENGEDLVADFSFQAGHNPNEPPTYGWRYKNLFLKVYPE